MLDDDQIGDVLRSQSHDLAEAARVLVDLANDNGGKDNVSVVLAKVQRSFAARSSWFERLISWFD